MPFERKSLFRNYIFNFIKTFAGIVFPLITFTYSARILGVDGIGRVNFSKSFITYFSMFAMLGMQHYGTREAAKLREDRDKLSKYVQEMLIINGATTVLAYVFLLLSILLVPRLKGYSQLLWISSCAILLQGMGMEWLYQGLEEYRYIAVRSLLFQFVSLVLMFIFVRDADDAAAYTAVLTIASSGSYVLNFLNVRKYVSFRRYDHYEIKKHLKPLLWLFALILSMELYTVLDSTVLGFIHGDAAVGRYTAAVKVNKITNTLIYAIGVVLIPRLSYYIKKGEYGQVRTLVDKAYNYVFMLSVPAAIGLFMLSNEIIVLFSGQAFSAAASTMRILTPIVLVIPFSVTTNQQTLIPMGQEKLMLIATSVGAMINFIFNLCLIPRFAEQGAAIATVLAETVVAVISYSNASRFFEMRKFFSRYYQYWIAAVPIPLIAIIFKQLPIHYVIRMIMTIIFSCICYFGILFFIKNEYFLAVVKKVISYENEKLSKVKLKKW